MKIQSLTLLTLALASCVVGPNYKRPDAAMTGKWKEGGTSKNAQVPDEWWKLFHDSELNKLVAQSLAQNQDLRGALAHVETARALIGVQRAAWFPQLSNGGGFTEQRVSHGVATANLPPGTNFTPRLETQNYATSFNLSYEVDLWGRVRRNVESAKADMQAAADTLDVQRLSIASAVATNYFLLRSLDAQHHIVVGTIQSREEAFDLQNSKFKAGLTNESDTTRARTELEQAKATLEVLQILRGTAEHAIAVLCGKAPVDFSISKNSDSLSPPSVPVGVPSELLQRRPDMRAAEQNLISTNAQIGVAQAAFYPSFNLMGAGGFQSLDAGTFLNWQNRVLSIGPSVGVPILNGGRNKSNLKAAQSRYEESVAVYRQSLLVALRDVEDALLALKGYALQRNALEAAVHSTEDTERLARTRQEKGLTSYFEVVDAERDNFSARLALAQVEGQRMMTTVQLFKAMGGGWRK